MRTLPPLPLALGFCGLLALLPSTRAQETPRPVDPERTRERTCFQTHAPWAPELQLGSDVAICYGIDKTLPERIAGWKAQGYVTHLMTGVSWGEYQDYLYGRFDGKNHVDEAQTERDGDVISHGGDVYYMSPGESFGKFLSQGVKVAIDSGAEAIHLEEPEFWVRAGYSEGFKREWKAYYGEDWIPPHSSPDAQYRASLLKYYLYQRALKQVFDFVKAENARTGRDVRCYVPTHSLINYAHWCIVSPESSLLGVGADGFIAQTWTGTARTPNFYEGRKKERTFETAFLEYGSMMEVVRASGGTVWFLNDPIEDNPNHSWTDYRTNWESTLTASLLWPQVSEVRGDALARAHLSGPLPLRREIPPSRPTGRARASAGRLRHRASDRHHRAERHGPAQPLLGLRHSGHRRGRLRLHDVPERPAPTLRPRPGLILRPCHAPGEAGHSPPARPARKRPDRRIA